MWALLRFGHVLSAMAWVGRQLLLRPARAAGPAATAGPGQPRPAYTRGGRPVRHFTVAVFLPLQLLTGVALAAHRGMTVQRLAEPGYGRTLGAKVVLFAVVLVVSGVHGAAVGRSRDGLARLAAIITLLGSVGIVLLATSLVP